MEKCNFKVGDKVIIKEWDEMVKEYGINSWGGIDCHPYSFSPFMKILCGEEATIIGTHPDGTVLLDFKTDFESRSNLCILSYCINMIKHAKEHQTIVIYQKDNRVIAKDKTTNRTAMAICSPEDEFNFKIGASIAFERLVGRDLIDKARKVVDEIEIGNSVKIIDVNKQYIKYINFFKDNNMSCELATRYYYGKTMPCDEIFDVFEVVATGFDTRGNKVCVIRNKPKGIYAGYYLFNIDGLKKC